MPQDGYNGSFYLPHDPDDCPISGDAELPESLRTDADLADEIRSSIRDLLARNRTSRPGGAKTIYMGTTQRRRSGGLDHTPEDDLELPDVCPDCGFEPADSRVLGAGIPDELREKRAELLGETPGSFWRSAVETSSDGSYAVRVRCPDCGEIVATEHGEIDVDGFYEVPDDA